MMEIWFLKHNDLKKVGLWTKSSPALYCSSCLLLIIISHFKAYKILSNIILGKIKPYIEKVMGYYQNGFRDGRSVIDNIFALKIINEKLWEYNQSVQYLFIDFQKAYDSLHRDTLWECMKEFKFY